MALVTVQRSPSPSNSPESVSSDVGDGLVSPADNNSSLKSPLRARSATLSQQSLANLRRLLATVRLVSRLRFSESYFAVKGAALILPQSECPRTITRGSHGGDIQTHLQSMFYLLRPQDTIKVAVKLECPNEERNRYMAVVSTSGRQDTEESVILGIDIEDDKASIGLVLPIWGSTLITLDGDGGFKVTSEERLHIFKPVSVQAMWSALQSLIKARDIAHQLSYFAKGLTHTWLTYYEVRILSSQCAINEWNFMEDIESHRPDPNVLKTKPTEELEIENLIRVKLKEIMLTVDLEEVTSKYLRTRLEEETGLELRSRRQFIDEEMIIILRQMDSASEIFPFLYLGSEWNASNLEELKVNGIDHILNVTREIDNFFPGLFEYANVRVYDVEQSELLKYWDNTFKFISKAREANSKVLVHCKMGISRSASTVIAYAMKEYGWSLDKALQHTKSRRNCIRPNSGFMQQLVTYQGILDASKHRNNQLWRSQSAGDLLQYEGEELCMEVQDILSPPPPDQPRPRSWSPEAQHMASDNDLSDEELHTNFTEMENGRLRGKSDIIPDPPFLMWDDLEDMSSQSVDSLIDFNYDEPSSKHSSSYDSKPRPIVELIAYRIYSGCDGGPEGPTDTRPEASGDESDIEDFAAEESSRRVQRGFYDVQMLSADFLGAEVEGQEGDTDVPPEFINYFLHPDVKMELLMAQQRKNKRIAQMLTRDNLQPCTTTTTVSSTLRGGGGQAKPPATTPQVTKLRADNSWIKEIPPSPQDPDKMAGIDEEEDTAAACEEEPAVEEAVLQDSSPPTGATPTTEPNIQPTSDEQVTERCPPPPPRERLSSSEHDTSPPPALLTQPPQPGSAGLASPDQDTQSLEGETSRSGVDSDSTNPDVGVFQHYHKEDIPWHPGTVKRHKKDLEKKIAKRVSSSSASSDSFSDSGSSENLGDLEIVAPQDSQHHSRSLSGVQNICISGVELGETSTDDPPPGDATTSHITSPPGGSSSTQESSQSSPDGAAGSARTSIYELEEIPLEPGVVQRTKQEIEMRGSQEGVDEQKPVQRSSSLKEQSPNSSKKDRTSERRRTCTPVLRTPSTGTDDISSEETSGGDEEKQEVKVMMVGQETVEVVQGKVKKHKRAIESRSSKSECDAVEELTSPESASEVSSPLPEYTKQRSQSLPLDANVEIPSGAVLKQKKELESRLNSGGSCSSASKEDPPIQPSQTKPIHTADTQSDESKKGLLTSLTTGKGSHDSAAPPAAGQTLVQGIKSSFNNRTSGCDNKDTAAAPGVQQSSSPEPKSLNVKMQQSKLKVDLGKGQWCEEAKEGDQGEQAAPDSPLVVQEGTDARTLSAYPEEEDIPWSVGTVRQQKEALEKVAMESTSSQNKSPTGEVGEVPKPAPSSQGSLWEQSGEFPSEGNFRRSCSFKSAGKESKDIVPSSSSSSSATSSVTRSSSFKENTLGRTELKISLSAPINVPVHTSRKDILMSKDNSSSSSPNQRPPEEKPISPTLEAELKKFASKKEVLILEATKDKSATAPKAKESWAGSSCTADLASKLASDKSMMQPVEEKKFWDLVDMFEKPKDQPQTVEGATKPQEGRMKSVSPPEVAAAVKPVTLSSSNISIVSSASDGSAGSGPQTIPMSVQRETETPRKSRKLHGKSHPLTKLTGGGGGGGDERSGRNKNPVYNTM